MKIKYIFKYFLIFVLFISALISVAEWYIKKKGYTVEPPLSSYYEKFKEFDLQLGWVCKPGKILSCESDELYKCYETRMPDTSRKSRPIYEKKSAYRVMVIGCSMTYGMGVKDEETWVWLLNERFPNITFDNFGVYGYGTYQCLLRERQRFAQGDKYDLVLYVAFSDHLKRNICWDCYVGSTTEPLYVLNPVVDIDKDGRLCFYGGIPRWFGDDCLAIINYIKRVYYSKLVYNSNKVRKLCKFNEYLVMAQLLKRMDECARDNGSKFAVTVIHNEDFFLIPRKKNMDILCKNAIDMDEVNEHKLELPEEYDFPYFTVGNANNWEKYDTRVFASYTTPKHPGPAVHTAWADRIGDWIELYGKKQGWNI